MGRAVAAGYLRINFNVIFSRFLLLAECFNLFFSLNNASDLKLLLSFLRVQSNSHLDVARF
jgi:hypothetical protein